MKEGPSSGNFNSSFGTSSPSVIPRITSMSRPPLRGETSQGSPALSSSLLTATRSPLHPLSSGSLTMTETLPISPPLHERPVGTLSLVGSSSNSLNRLSSTLERTSIETESESWSPTSSSSRERRVMWDDSVVDNEFLGRKKSKGKPFFLSSET